MLPSSFFKWGTLMVHEHCSTIVKNYGISEAAEMGGVSKETLRYYESIGLIEVHHRSEGGFREYNQDVIERLRFIKGAQDSGFTLKEITELLLLANDPTMLSLPVREMVEINSKKSNQR
jgi:DNA-binding transcriptional MerR regulator